MDTEVLPLTITALLTLVSPFITALFTKREMSSTTKSWIAVVISAVIAVGYVFMQGGFAAIAGPEEFFAALGIAYGIGQLVYNTILKTPAKVVEAKYGITGDKPVEETPAASGPTVGVTVPEEYRGSQK